MWKARKIFLKGLKMIPSGEKNLELSIEMLKFQVEFMRKILGRKKIIMKGGSENEAMKFIHPAEES